MNLVELKNIKKSYFLDGNRLDVLKGISFSILENESISIVGPSGAGKSTLLHLIGLLDSPTEGEIIFKETYSKNISDNKQAKIRNKEIGFIFQFHHLLPEFTVLENVIMPLLILGKNNINVFEEGKILLNKVGLTSKINNRPNELAGGEQQRAAIARALINKPSLLLADEPTGNLDSANSEIIHSLLFQLQKENNMSLVIVTHNSELSLQTQKRITLIDGQISKIEIK